jgi:hypothetical protein
MKIIESRNIFLISSYHMNDYKENFTLQDKLEKLFIKNPSLLAQSEQVKLQEEIKRRSYAVPYLFCLSELVDSLGQWRAYGDDGNGVCIGFDPNEMKLDYRLPFQGASRRLNSSLHNVLYSDEEQESLLEEIITYCKNLSSQKGVSYPFDSFFESASMFLLRCSPILKLKEFKEEKEWRIIYSVVPLGNKDGKFLTFDNNTDIKFLSTRNNIKSYFTFEFNKDMFSKMIKTIHLGPKTAISPYEIRSFLDVNGMTNSEVIRSSVSYR